MGGLMIRGIGPLPVLRGCECTGLLIGEVFCFGWVSFGLFLFSLSNFFTPKGLHVYLWDLKHSTICNLRCRNSHVL